MKKGILFLAVFGILCLNAVSQVDNLSDLPPVKKGYLLFSDGKKVEFKNLKTDENTLHYTDLSGRQQQQSSDELYKVVKTGNSAGEYALYCGAGGLLGALLGTSSWDAAGLGDQKAGFIIGATVACTGIGALIGAMVPKEKVMYKNTELDFSFLLMPATMDYQLVPAIGLKVKL